ncbi:MAG: aminomethyl-transferring glycine dehydrogenase subunit GcvPA [Eubacteriales bacterium]|nr:aminomethyl-transferring glycine dehydrogenase subunit GcvPA [Eubacteriales bacterium]
MGSFVPSNPKEREEMLKTVGVESFRDLYRAVPEALLLPREKLNVPDGVSEPEAMRAMETMAEKNRVFRAVLRGAGAYWHYIPAIVGRVTSKEQFLTAYTPYQAEISQGVLQSIFEYQTMMCELTGMAVSNASVYDGATAAAEAAAMCVDRKRSTVYLSKALAPDVIRTVQTYCWGANRQVRLIPVKDGLTDLEALKGMLAEDSAAAGVIFAQPNYFGNLEDCAGLIELTHQAGAKAVMSVNPIAMGLLQTPGELGADIAVGEGQPLGMPMGFGGPYLGFMCASQELFRHLPGRIVGETTDAQGKRCYVLTLQAREQHIRREKAASNICSNQALCAMTAAVYLAAMGAEGITKTARLCYDKAHYLAAELEKIGLKRRDEADFFHEFVTETDCAEKLLVALEAKGILGGLPVENGVLWCCTEQCDRSVMDEVVAICREAMA